MNPTKANPLAPAGRLRDREERFRTTVDYAPVGISHTDMQGRWLYVNQRFCEIVGYTREELLQRTFADITHPDSLAENVALEEKLFAGEIDRFSMEKQYIRKDGELVWVNLTVSLVRHHEGHPAYTIGIVEDITERKQSLEALHNAEKLLAAGRLAATIAHELNNPLAGIFNLVYLLQSDPAMSRASRQLLDTLDVQLQRVADVTKRALTFYRETSAPEPVQVCPVLEEVLSAFEAQLKSAHISIEVECVPDATIMGFPGELRHTFANLLTNAIDALGEINEKRSLYVGARLGFDWKKPDRKGIRVCFRDNGCGIPRSSWARLYDPFFTTKLKANGLGLWVAKGIIEKHGGSIRLRSRTAGPRRGSYFSIFLPYQPPDRSQTEPLTAQIGRELLQNRGSAS